MAEIRVELDAYVIPENHSIWKCFPGKTYRFLEVVQEASVVFLDVRNLPEVVPGPADWNDQAVLEHITNDRWQKAKEQAGPQRVPRGSPDISAVDKRTLTFLHGLFFDAKKGDLIALPAEGYRKEVLVGELLDEPGNLVTQNANDGGRVFSYLGRRVRWLASQEKRFFKREVLDLLHIQTAFHLLPRSMYEEFYRLAYKSYMFGDIYAATFTTSKDIFSTSDNAIVSIWFNALSAVRDAVERGVPIGDKSYLDLGLLQTMDAKEGELAINVNSPGQFLLRSIGVFSLVAMAMLPLTAVSAEDMINGNVKVSVKTVGAADSHCTLKIDQAIADYAKTLSALRVQQHCEMGKRAKIEATLGTKARLKN